MGAHSTVTFAYSLSLDGIIHYDPVLRTEHQNISHTNTTYETYSELLYYRPY